MPVLESLAKEGFLNGLTDRLAMKIYDTFRIDWLTTFDAAGCTQSEVTQHSKSHADGKNSCARLSEFPYSSSGLLSPHREIFRHWSPIEFRFAPELMDISFDVCIPNGNHKLHNRFC